MINNSRISCDNRCFAVALHLMCTSAGGKSRDTQITTNQSKGINKHLNNNLNNFFIHHWNLDKYV